MKTYRIFLTILISSVFLFNSCQDFFDVNTSKDTPSEVSPEQLLPVLVFYFVFDVYIGF